MNDITLTPFQLFLVIFAALSLSDILMTLWRML